MDRFVNPKCRASAVATVGVRLALCDAGGDFCRDKAHSLQKLTRFSFAVVLAL